MQYTSGLALLFSVVGAFSVTGDRPLAKLARVLLDAAGLGFGVYLLTFVLLTLIARRVQRRAMRVLPAARVPRHVSACLPGAQDDAGAANGQA